MDSLPIACSLGATDLSSREREWQSVLEAALIETAAVPAGVRLRLTNNSETLAGIERLVGLERDCCAWIEWTLTDLGSSLSLEATAQTQEGVSVLRDWFQSGWDNRRALSDG